MSEINKPITFCELLERCRRIEIPLIQRDYAQGRDKEKDVRDEFLKTLHGALSLASDNVKLPLNLDFIYGSMEGEDKETLIPLDGQQRLTTLFLLHWYLAWQDGELRDFKSRVWDSKHARFTYSVRPSSTEFFDKLVSYQPSVASDSVHSVRILLQDEPWFFLHWRLDPTIQSALTMLDAIHERFRGLTELYGRLVHQELPVITFQLLPLEHFGLTDDLYIKMNARGKPLTAFETFKARFEELLTELFPTEYRQMNGSNLPIYQFLALRIDTQWTRFFWQYRNQETNTIDDEAMNLIWALIRVSLDPSEPSFVDGTSSLRSKLLPATYMTFHEYGWLTREFAENLICLLEAWSSKGKDLAPQLPDTRYFDEEVFFKNAIREPARIEYTGLVMFAAFTGYLRQHDGSVKSEELNDWMRVVFNLSQNSDIERPEEYGRSLAGLKKLLPYSHQILSRLTNMEIEPLGFSPQQVREEVLKATLILSHAGWKSRIVQAEHHGYFKGQIQFLLDFSNASNQADATSVEDWDDETHKVLQVEFDEYLQKAQLMFHQSGLIPLKSQLWKRALLVMGNYLLTLGRNYSFVTDPPSYPDSWKRLLRDDTQQRQHLKSLWDKLDASAPIAPQLKQIIDTASDLEEWRSAIVKHPQVINYCGQQEFRWEADSNEIYLLRKRQMNGAHAELFSYALYLELKPDASRKSLEPLRLDSYTEVTETGYEPCIVMSLTRGVYSINFLLFSSKSQFAIQINQDGLSKLPEVDLALRNKCGFTENGDKLLRYYSRDEIRAALRKMARTLNE
jgi:hypothetical protein